MTSWQELATRLERRTSTEDGNGDAAQGEARPENSEEAAWEQASAPAQVARHIAEGVFGVHLPVRLIPLLTHGMHWAYGTGWGGLYGPLRDSAEARELRR
jgi:hypothetical protein